jgi:hypothetical protein
MLTNKHVVRIVTALFLLGVSSMSHAAPSAPPAGNQAEVNGAQASENSGAPERAETPEQVEAPEAPEVEAPETPEGHESLDR